MDTTLRRVTTNNFPVRRRQTNFLTTARTISQQRQDRSGTIARLITQRSHRPSTLAPNRFAIRRISNIEDFFREVRNNIDGYTRRNNPKSNNPHNDSTNLSSVSGGILRHRLRQALLMDIMARVNSRATQLIRTNRGHRMPHFEVVAQRFGDHFRLQGLSRIFSGHRIVRQGVVTVARRNVYRRSHVRFFTQLNFKDSYGTPNTKR